MASNLFPFLNTGQMFAVFHMAGIVPDLYDILNMTVSIGAMNGASSFKTLGVIFSGPAALVGFSLLRSFFTPDTVRDRPFNLKVGGLWFFVSFRIFFSDNTRVRIFFFCHAKCEFFFPEFNIRSYDKNSESDYLFFPPPKSEYFFRKKP